MLIIFCIIIILFSSIKYWQVCNKLTRFMETGPLKSSQIIRWVKNNVAMLSKKSKILKKNWENWQKTCMSSTEHEKDFERSRNTRLNLYMNINCCLYKYVHWELINIWFVFCKFLNLLCQRVLVGRLDPQNLSEVISSIGQFPEQNLWRTDAAWVACK